MELTERVATRELTFSDALTITEAAYAYARERDWLIGIAIVDGGGNLIMASRMDGGKFLAPDAARGKAFACAAYGVSSAELEAVMNERPAIAPGFVASSGGRMIPGGGGLPIWADGRCIGGAGISGRSSEEDEEILTAAIGAVGLSVTSS